MAVLIGLAAAGLLAILDLKLKSHFAKKIRRGREIPVANGKILLRNVKNQGAAFNFLESFPELVQFLSVCAMVILGVYELILLCFKGKKGKKIGTALVLGGALSNTYDRLEKGYVRDYIAVNAKNEKVKDMTFNIGDLMIVVGIVIRGVFGKEK